VAQIEPQIRSRMMAAVRQKDTGPEIVTRKLLHRLGYRYRVHGKGLPGKPDIVFPSQRKVIFIHGCFWHRHTCHTGSRAVRTRSAFWKAKFARNQARDLRNEKELKHDGWESLTIWECETCDQSVLAKRLIAFLGLRGSSKRCRMPTSAV
jgi:DNA mismatch endonuclease, patch repair protein